MSDELDTTQGRLVRWSLLLVAAAALGLAGCPPPSGEPDAGLDEEADGGPADATDPDGGSGDAELDAGEDGDVREGGDGEDVTDDAGPDESDGGEAEDAGEVGTDELDGGETDGGDAGGGSEAPSCPPSNGGSGGTCNPLVVECQYVGSHDSSEVGDGTGCCTSGPEGNDYLTSCHPDPENNGDWECGVDACESE